MPGLPPVLDAFRAHVCDDLDCHDAPRYLILAGAVLFDESSFVYGTFACDRHRAGRMDLARRRVVEGTALDYCPIGPLAVPVDPDQVIPADAAKLILADAFLCAVRATALLELDGLCS